MCPVSYIKNNIEKVMEFSTCEEIRTWSVDLFHSSIILKEGQIILHTTYYYYILMVMVGEA